MFAEEVCEEEKGWLSTNLLALVLRRLRKQENDSFQIWMALHQPSRAGASYIIVEEACGEEKGWLSTNVVGLVHTKNGRWNRIVTHVAHNDGFA